MKKLITILVTLAILFSVSGCVPQSKYDELQERLAGIIMQNEALSKQISDLKNQNEGYKNRIDELKGENEKLKTNVVSASEKADNAGDTPKALSDNYIGNKKSKKFHLPACGGLPDEKNRIEFDSRDAAVNAGYGPCKRCNP